MRADSCLHIRLYALKAGITYDMCHFFYTYPIAFLSDRWQNENLKAQSLCGLEFSPVYYIDIYKVFWVYLLVIRVDL
jgi:hypothetical protein